jgi:hypothetical protein
MSCEKINELPVASSINLKDLFQKPVDFDLAMFYIGCFLGVFENLEIETFCQNKWIFWTENPTRDKLLYQTNKFVEQGYLIYDDEWDKYVWNTLK